MRFHDPQTQRNLLRLATKACGNQPMEPRDQASWAEVLSSVFNKLLLIGGLTSFLGAFRSDPQSDCWQTLITSLCFMLVCLTGVGMTRAIERPGYLAAFVNLPISGEPIYQWMRRRLFIK